MFFAKARSSVRGEERYGAPPLLVGIGPCTTGGVGANLVVKDGVDGVGGGGNRGVLMGDQNNVLEANGSEMVSPPSRQHGSNKDQF